MRAEWDRAYDAYARVSDLLFVTGYTEGVIRPVHVNMAFGDGGPERVAADAEAAVAAIDDWAIEACGDFCSRWPEFESTLRYEEAFDWERWEQSLDRYELLLVTGARLVPDEIQDSWETAADVQKRRFVAFRENGFRWDIDEERALREWGVLPWEEAKEASDAALDRIGRWADANCDADAVTTGAPILKSLCDAKNGSPYLYSILGGKIEMSVIKLFHINRFSFGWNALTDRLTYDNALSAITENQKVLSTCAKCIES